MLFLLALGAYNNRYAVPRLKRQVASAVSSAASCARWGSELALFVAAIGVTAVLVAEPPAKAVGRSCGAGRADGARSGRTS